jgi:magnesium transporter
MDRSFETLMAYEDQEEAVRMFAKYDRAALPVVDTDGILVGIVTVDDVIDVAEEEATEDMHKMAGMDALDDYYSQTSVGGMVKKRVRWLILLFMGQMLTVTAMGAYQSIIASAVLLSLFIPMIISSGGNSGSQAATLIIRALATDDIKSNDWKRIFNREFLSGLMLGGLIGLLGFGMTILWGYLSVEISMQELLLTATSIGLSLLGVILFGNLSGAMLPFILTKLKLDPAVTSAPFVATLVDVTGIIIYFSISMFLLKGVIF